jgi:hypothetical protein
MRALLIGWCASAVCIFSGAAFFAAGAANGLNDGTRLSTYVSADRAHKSDRLWMPFALPGGAARAEFAVIELAAPAASAITVRDRNGNVLYRVDPKSQTTVIAERMFSSGNQDNADRSRAPGGREALPVGCENAFSPYAAPRMAGVIGRCLSALEPPYQVASIAR